MESSKPRGKCREICRKTPAPEIIGTMTEEVSYRSIAVASTFSPRFEQVLAEAKRIRDRFDSQLSLVYVGDNTEEATRRFGAALERLSLPPDSPIYFEQGDAAGGILQAIARNNVDLIIAGALEKELVLHPFLGNVARRLLREGRSSVILFTSPQRDPKPLRKMVFVADYSVHAGTALRRTLHLAGRENSERLFVIRVITTFDEARAAHQGAGHTDEEARLEQFVLAIGHTDVPIEVRCIRGNTGFAAADFVKSVEADLLIVPLDPANNAGQLPPNLEWLLEMIPCNLWVIR